MLPAMTAAEITLFTSFLSCSKAYVEFGAGGSSVLASQLVQQSIISIDSSREWLEKIAIACASGGKRVVPQPMFVDIGPIRDLGYPQGQEHRHLWSDYHTTVWCNSLLSNADLYLVDGRFRVACFLQTIMRCSVQAIILIHDFANRPEYHIVREFATELARAENLSAFQRSPQSRPAAINECIAKYALDPR